MKFKTTDLGPNGTHLQGYIETTFLDLESVFGKPAFGPNDPTGDKTTCEWIVEFQDGTVATIYDYKVASTPYERYQWHIGGFDTKAVQHVTKLIEALAV